MGSIISLRATLIHYL